MMMRKFLTVLMIFGLCMSLASCGEVQPVESPTNVAENLVDVQEQAESSLAQQVEESSQEESSQAKQDKVSSTPSKPTQSKAENSSTIKKPTQSNHTGHTHDYTEVTCTTDGKCKTCGAVAERARGHVYSSATCTAPKWCLRCETEFGSALGHTCKVGECERCGEFLPPKVKLPQTPIITAYSVYTTMKITSIKYEFDYEYLVLTFSGEKTFGDDGDYVGFDYQVLDSEGYVVITGSWQRDGLNTGDKFRNQTETIYPGEYTWDDHNGYTIVISDLK